MFTSNKAASVGQDKVLIEAFCLSSDTKPTNGVANGSIALEMDTSTLYFFDEKNNIWRAWS